MSNPELPPAAAMDRIDELLGELGGAEFIRSILDVVCMTTNMGFAAVAHVTENRWVACQVRDDIGFGLPAGGELPVKTTLCDSVRGTGTAIVIDHVAADPVYRDHHTPATYGLQSYIAVPIVLEDGEIFGTLCAIDPAPKRVDTPEIRGMFGLFAQLIATQVDRMRATRQNISLEQQVSDVLDDRKIYADIIESSPLAVTALDLDYRVLAINRANVEAFQRVYGKQPKPGDDFLALFEGAPEYMAQQRAIWSRALTGETFVVVQEFGDAHIERRSFEVRFSPLRNGKGERIGASSTSYDVTDRVRLAAAQEQLRHAQKLDALGQLTGGVAHDFNNLLMPIVAGLHGLKRREVIGEREHKLIDAAARSAERARKLVQRLLALAHRQPLQPQAVDLAALVADMTQLITSTVGPQVQLKIVIAQGLPPAYADANQLEMALLNLSVNARDAMPSGGTLRIEADATQVDAGHPTGLLAGNYLRLVVADTGEGMDAETLQRAAEPFFSTKGIGKGTGLGLSMVDGLARQLGGILTIDSTIGVGTRATIWLRTSASGIDTTNESPAEPRPHGAGLVLLVDDEDLVRLSVADMLVELGYSVVEARSSEDALSKLRAGLAPDFLVTDHLMPGMTGFDLIKLLADERPEIRPLMVSGYTDAVGLPPSLAVLNKPFLLEELGAVLARLRKASR